MDRLDVHLRWILAAPIYACAYAVACWVFWWMAQRRGLANETTLRVMLAGLIGGLIGANVVQLFATGLPGKTIEGGIIGGWLAVELTKRYLGMTRSTGDLFALALPAGEVIGRVACFIGGCCYGKVATALPWAVYDHGALRHPTQLYLSGAALCCFAGLYAIEQRAFLPDRALFALGGMLFCVDRFIVEFFRAGATMLGPMTLAQVGCTVGFALFSVLFIRTVKIFNHASSLHRGSPMELWGR